MGNTENLVRMALFAALIAVGAFIRIPVPVCPFTLQFLFTMLAGLLLGGKYGALSVLVYLCVGLLGLPVFAMAAASATCSSPPSAFSSASAWPPT